MTTNIEAEARIQAPREDVWSVLADIQGIPKWAAAITEAKVDGAPGKGATRHCTLTDGGVIEERFTAWKEGELQRYEITGDMPTTTLVCEWELTEDDGDTIVAYRATFDPTEDVPAEAVAKDLGGLAEFLVQALKTYVETGKALQPPEA